MTLDPIAPPAAGHVAGPVSAPGAILTAAGLRVDQGRRTVLDVPRLDLIDGEVLGVIGPNGAGKSTLLRCLTLLDRPAAGEIRLRGEAVRWRDVVAFRRRTALLFQESLLLDTTAAGNVATGLRLRGVRRAEIDRRVGAWLDRLGIAHLARRSARTLSGGEARRVSLARALVLDPEILFLDEPFSALDAPTRAAFAGDLADLIAERSITTVLVTHDRAEAGALTNRLAVLIDGRIARIGATERVLRDPGDPRVAAFLAAAELPRRRREKSEE